LIVLILDLNQYKRDLENIIQARPDAQSLYS